MNYRNLIEDHYERIIRQSGVRRIRPYDLRHTYATLTLKAGVPIKVVSESLGHRSIELTLRTYTHVLASMREEHLERLEGLFPRTQSGTQMRRIGDRSSEEVESKILEK